MLRALWKCVKRVRLLPSRLFVLGAGLCCGAMFGTDVVARSRTPLPPDVVTDTTLVGTLKPITNKGKSVERYCGARMVLETATDTVPLRLAHRAVKVRLQALVGKRVRLQGYYERRAMPMDNTIQRPINLAPDGTEQPFVCTTFVVKRVHGQ